MLKFSVTPDAMLFMQKKRIRPPGIPYIALSMVYVERLLTIPTLEKRAFLIQKNYARQSQTPEDP
jgi:hypothetical protein